MLKCITNLKSQIYRLKTDRSLAQNSQYGFTLVELLVILTILGILIGIMIATLDPFTQLYKSEDAQRKSDFKRIRTALDAYYHDTNCFPKTLDFGNEWEIDETLYMKKIPQDPKYTTDPSQCYFYAADESATCPQWHILFSKLAVPPGLGNLHACQLDENCLPSNYRESGFTFCDYGGKIDCEYLSSKILPEDGCAGWVTPVPPTPTDTPGGLYFCACGVDHLTVCNLGNGLEEGVIHYQTSSCNNQCGLPC